VYGSSKRANAMNHPLLRSKLKEMNRQALHASIICFSHPVTGETLSFSSPLPDDMSGLCGFLNHISRKNIQEFD
jgi:23S rRNA pseudouridine1911/1915/1917 synthase